MPIKGNYSTADKSLTVDREIAMSFVFTTGASKGIGQAVALGSAQPVDPAGGIVE